MNFNELSLIIIDLFAITWPHAATLCASFLFYRSSASAMVGPFFLSDIYVLIITNVQWRKKATAEDNLIETKDD